MELVHGTMELGPITNTVFTLMRRFLVYMVTHGASPRHPGARSDYTCSVYIDASISGLHVYIDASIYLFVCLLGLAPKYRGLALWVTM